MEVRHGTTRRVLLVGRLAIKFPNPAEYRLFLCGLLANQQENRWWRTFQHQRDRMAPVLAYVPGGWLLVMKRCRPIDRQTFFSMDGDWPAKYGIPVEHKQDSYGLNDGRVVAVDYGS